MFRSRSSVLLLAVTAWRFWPAKSKRPNLRPTTPPSPPCFKRSGAGGQRAKQSARSSPGATSLIKANLTGRHVQKNNIASARSLLATFQATKFLPAAPMHAVLAAKFQCQSRTLSKSNSFFSASS